ncbi:hypothetical protein UFOVP156_15 [uncultured Caudovirales phage]|uniref:Uncharacterized protein n=1 Tax=uncultured Caudovirales phage TaxID=2100421 RepID=A0A6J7WDB0_9CAUD|nr:hypothetical protein UFOVP156_15 [uncultured Caudovirales phage]
MDMQHLINTGVGALLAAFGWFARQLWDAVKELRTDLENQKLHVSEAYVKKSDVDNIRAEFDKRFDKLEMMIGRLFDKIDQKADR